ncbi:hypothetical protein [Arthrobacter sp. HLT1-21]
MPNLIPIGTKGLLTIAGDQQVATVADTRAIQIATDDALGRSQGQSTADSKAYTDAELAAKKFARPFIAANTDWNTLTETGSYPVPYTGQNFTNAPGDIAGRLIVGSSENPNSPAATHLFVGYAGAGIFYRSQGSTGLWTKWDKIDKLHAGEAQSHRAMLVSAFKARRGGVIGTSGKSAVSFRFDHGLTNFETKVLPILRKYGIPWSQATNSNQLANAGNTSSFLELSGWCINDGGEVWNHGRDHASASGPEPIFKEIVTALDELKAGMPALIVEGWAPPGVAAGGFDGYAPAETLEQHWNTYAGQLVLAYHAAVSGYIPGLYRPLPADLPIGFGHATIDAQTPAWVDGVIRGAVNSRMGVQLMLHSANVDTVGNMTTAQVDEVFANVAALRDSGQIEVLTPTGMLLADPESDYRHNLISNGYFKDAFTGWLNTVAWATTTVSGITYATTTTGTPITQAIGFSRKEAFLGGTRELVYQVRAGTGAVVRTAATGTGITASKDHTLAASPNWVEVRKPITIPANFTGDLTVAVGRVSGGIVDIADIRLRSI